MTSDFASRVMLSSDRRRTASTLLVLLGAFAGGAILRAQDTAETGAPPAGEAPPAATPPAAAEQTPAAPDETPVPADASATPAATPPTPSAADADDASAEAAPPAKGPSPNRFEPTEKVRADFDVSFPVDI
jgi:hypothetical protein